jgi:hypothetical protein
MTDYTEPQLKQRYRDVMGNELGDVFHHLMQEAAFLHLKWNEYIILFGTGPERVDLLNRAAPGFFHLVQDSWWDDLLLHISRMTDDRTDVLTVKRLPKLVQAAIRDEVHARLDVLDKAAKFARDLRNRHIAHRNIDIALKRAVVPLPSSSREQVRGAIQALDRLLHFVEYHFLNTEPTFYDHLDALGGSESVLDIIRRGLRDRDRQFGLGPLE